jgi:hypothetical protein
MHASNDDLNQTLFTLFMQNGASGPGTSKSVPREVLALIPSLRYVMRQEFAPVLMKVNQIENIFINFAKDS